MNERLSSACLALAALTAQLTSAWPVFAEEANHETTSPGATPGAVSPPGGPSSESASSATTPVVAPPTLVRDAAPVYPEAAFAEGLEAEVRVVITVNEDGSVSNPEVPEPVGHGFDEAA